MKELEYQLNSVYDLRVRGEVPFLITSKNLHRKEYYFLCFELNLSGGAYFYWSLGLRACNIAKNLSFVWSLKYHNLKKDSLINLFKVADKQTRVLRG